MTTSTFATRPSHSGRVDCLLARAQHRQSDLKIRSLLLRRKHHRPRLRSWVARGLLKLRLPLPVLLLRKVAASAARERQQLLACLAPIKHLFVTNTDTAIHPVVADAVKRELKVHPRQRQIATDVPLSVCGWSTGHPWRTGALCVFGFSVVVACVIVAAAVVTAAAIRARLPVAGCGFALPSPHQRRKAVLIGTTSRNRNRLLPTPRRRRRCCCSRSTRSMDSTSAASGPLLLL